MTMEKRIYNCNTKYWVPPGSWASGGAECIPCSSLRCLPARAPLDWERRTSRRRRKSVEHRGFVLAVP